MIHSSLIFLSHVCYVILLLLDSNNIEWRHNQLNSISLLSEMQSIPISEDKKLSWDQRLMLTDDDEASLPIFIYLFFILREGDSKRDKTRYKRGCVGVSF